MRVSFAPQKTLEGSPGQPALDSAPVFLPPSSHFHRQRPPSHLRRQSRFHGHNIQIIDFLSKACHGLTVINSLEKSPANSKRPSLSHARRLLQTRPSNGSLDRETHATWRHYAIYNEANVYSESPPPKSTWAYSTFNHNSPTLWSHSLASPSH